MAKKLSEVFFVCQLSLASKFYKKSANWHLKLMKLMSFLFWLKS